jgi:hypothetical protein
MGMAAAMLRFRVVEWAVSMRLEGARRGRGGPTARRGGEDVVSATGSRRAGGVRAAGDERRGVRWRASRIKSMDTWRAAKGSRPPQARTVLQQNKRINYGVISICVLFFFHAAINYLFVSLI